ncbi:hypothetical protein ACXYMX_14490 [Sporosarcina sp. CAU 1771]
MYGKYWFRLSKIMDIGGSALYIGVQSDDIVIFVGFIDDQRADIDA